MKTVFSIYSYLAQLCVDKPRHEAVSLPPFCSIIALPTLTKIELK